MALDELKNDLTAAETNVRSYLEHSEEYLKLQVFKVMMRIITSSLQTLAIGMGAVFALLLLSVGAAMALGDYLENNYLGFILVGAFYVLVSLVLYVFRARFNRPLLKKFSSFYFDES